jgi:hypothetical protein
MFSAAVINSILLSISVWTRFSGDFIAIQKMFVELATSIPQFKGPVHGIDIACSWGRVLIVRLKILPIITAPHSGFIQQTLVSDLIVMWRAWILLQDHKRVLILPCLLLWLGAFCEY